jgi:Xaa-Pro dipeptidase
MEDRHWERQKRVRDRMKQEGLESLLISEPAALFYLTGESVEPGERFMAYVLMEDGAFWVQNRLFPLRDETSVPVYAYSDGEDWSESLRRRLASCRRAGVDKMLPAAFLLRLQEVLPALLFVNGSFLVDDVRAVKDREEIEAMRRASAMNDHMMRRLIRFLYQGVTEKECARHLETWLEEAGADGVSFSPVISFGAHGAEPHHSPDGTVLAKNTVVLMDIGCRLHGYCSDMTRTVFFGSVGQKERQVHDIVRKACEAAEAAICPGVRLADIDHIARQIITDAGYGDGFTHRLGHFIGLTDHEAGEVGPASDIEARPGMIFSIEPGIYIPGEFGVRIEDLVLVTEDGCERLNHVPHGAGMNIAEEEETI